MTEVISLPRLAVAAALIAGVAACSDNNQTATPTQNTPPTPSGSATATPPSGKVPEVRAVRGNAFSPTTISLKVGETLHVTDTDPDAPHNFVVEGVGRSETMNEGDNFTLTFTKAGTYTFVCTFHESQGMKGTATVTS
ncbi:MAG TPA: cupredoxin domain-containing protein [Mycobacteriales bacterium]|nr:cupredoxin domain-containing protein [Mycobacteriales bacterium]